MSNGAQPPACAISVVIPTWNRPERLVACLAALAKQTFPSDQFEVIVVDDGGAASLERHIAPFRGQLRVNLVEQANAGPASARNTGAAHASGALLAFTDDDCEPDAEWLSALHARAVDQPGCLVGGQTLNALPDNKYSTASQLLIEYLYEYHTKAAGPDARTNAAAPAFFTSNNFAVPAALFHAVGGFDQTFPLAAGEDRELCDRWQHRGFALTSAPDARVHHGHALTLRRYWRQHRNYGRGAWHLRKARLVRGRQPLGIEPFAFYWGLVTYPWRVAPLHRAAPLVGLMWLSQVANAWGFFSERARDRSR